MMEEMVELYTERSYPVNRGLPGTATDLSNPFFIRKLTEHLREMSFGDWIMSSPAHPMSIQSFSSASVLVFVASLCVTAACEETRGGRRHPATCGFTGRQKCEECRPRGSDEMQTCSFVAFQLFGSRLPSHDHELRQSLTSWCCSKA